MMLMMKRRGKMSEERQPHHRYRVHVVMTDRSRSSSHDLPAARSETTRVGSIASLAMPRQDPHIIHKPPDQILILRNLMSFDEQSLPSNLRGRHFDLEFVFFVRFRSGLCLRPKGNMSVDLSTGHA